MIRFAEPSIPNYYSLLEDNTIAKGSSTNCNREIVVIGAFSIRKKPKYPQITRWNIRILHTKYSNIQFGVTSLIGETCFYYLYFDYGEKKKHNDIKRTKLPARQVSKGQIVGVDVDVENARIAFFLDGVSLGIAYENVSFDSPLYPCVRLSAYDDSVEILPFHYNDTNHHHNYES